MEFAEHLRKYLDESEIQNLIDSFNKKENKGLFLNTNKLTANQFINLFPNVKKHPIVDNAFLYDPNEYDFGKMLYHELGAYYIQDPSASLVPYFLNPQENMHVLDMCAAPGGKTILSSLLMHNKGIIYANDISMSRANILLSNVERLGLDNVCITSLDLTKLNGLNNSFDAIILDAPCSGSGMFRRSEEMKNDWTYEKVTKFSHIQKQLITYAYSLLKEGGKLIYSTCSYSYEEDEEVVQYLLDNTNAILLDLPQNNMFYRGYKLKETIHLFPHKFVGEGHYIALLQKPGKLLIKEKEQNYHITRIGQGKGKKKIIYNISLPMTPIKLLEKLSIRPGLFCSYTIGDETYISHHYSHFLNADDSYKLSDAELKKYLHGDQLEIKDEKNYETVSYLNLNVGAIKYKKGILKNLYPKNLRH